MLRTMKRAIALSYKKITISYSPPCNALHCCTLAGLQLQWAQSTKRVLPRPWRLRPLFLRFFGICSSKFNSAVARWHACGCFTHLAVVYRCSETSVLGGPANTQKEGRNILYYFENIVFSLTMVGDETRQWNTISC